MPQTACVFPYCPYPVTFDTYKGCSHNCKYCFINFRAGQKKTGSENVKIGEPISSLEKWCKGERNLRNSWCDWKIPICFGRNSDPFQPIEKEKKLTLQALKVLAKYNYPFIITTKGTFYTKDREYIEVLKDCNVCWQETMCCPSLNILEPNTPTFEERLEAMSILSNIVPRVVARSQPLFLDNTQDCIRSLQLLKSAGIHSVLVEAAELMRPYKSMRIKKGTTYQYPKDELEVAYQRIKNTCHANGLVFLSGDLRYMSDSLECCGCEGMSGFEPHRCNSIFYHLGGDKFQVRDNLKKKGTGEVWQNYYSGRKKYETLRNSSYEQMFKTYLKERR